MQHGTRSEHLPSPPPGPGQNIYPPPTWDLVTPPPPPTHLGLGYSTPPPTWDLVTPPPTPPNYTQAGGTHPTGMHPCYYYDLSFSFDGSGFYCQKHTHLLTARIDFMQSFLFLYFFMKIVFALYCYDKFDAAGQHLHELVLHGLLFAFECFIFCCNMESK